MRYIGVLICFYECFGKKKKNYKMGAGVRLQKL